MAKLGLTLQQLAGMGIDAPSPYAPMGRGLLDPTGPGAPMQTPPHKPGFMAPGSKGAMIAGIIGDTLASLSGGQPIFTMNMMAERRQRQNDEASEAQWSRRRQAENEDWRNRQAWEASHRPDDEFTRMVRASGVDPASPEGRALYQQRIERQTAEPDVVVTLPSGQLYIGPKSGMAAALGGSGAPTVPVGRLTPVEGGPASAPGGFPYR